MGRRIEKRRPATYADVQGAPETMVAELIDGTLYLSPRPAPGHARAASRLTASLGGFDGGTPGGWVILTEPELRLSPRAVAVVPDLAGWRRERLPARPETAYFDVAPDWVCEIRSPSTGALDRKVKMPTYAAASVSWLWLVDPEAETLEAYRRDPDRGTYDLLGVHSEDDKARIPPFDAVELDLSDLWRW